jgi:hypothetical protein
MSNLSFQNPNNKLQGQELKDAFVKIIKEDKINGKFTKGSYWSPEKQKGCAIGCSERALCTILGDKYENRRHYYLSKTLNIPESIFHLQDEIFESLPKTESDQFVVDFVEALPVGKDLTNVEYKVKIWILKKGKKYINKEIEVIIDKIIKLNKKTIAGKNVNYSEVKEEVRLAEVERLARSVSGLVAELEKSTWLAPWLAARSVSKSTWLVERSAESVFWQDLSKFLIKTLKESKF